MFPGFASTDEADEDIGDAIFTREFCGYSMMRRLRANREYICFGKDGVMMRGTSRVIEGTGMWSEPGCDRMMNIVGLKHVFEVGLRAIRFNAITMVDLMPVWVRANKCLSDQTVNGASRPNRLSLEVDVQVATFMNDGLKQQNEPVAVTRVPSHSSLVGDFVKALPTNDGAPLFGFFGRLIKHREPPRSGVTERDVSASPLPLFYQVPA